MEENSLTMATYQELINEGKLTGSRCRNCGAVFLPLRPICGKCQQAGMELVPMSGKGRVAAYSLIAIGPQMMIDEGFDRQHPYCSGIVELDEGVRIPARIVGVDDGKPVREVIGAPGMLEFLQRDNKPDVLVFKIL